jgi:outer membrane protein assembly complex protein YaeT
MRLSDLLRQPRSGTAFMMVVLLLLVIPASTAAQAVGSIEVITDSPEQAEQVPAALGLLVGQPIDRGRMRAGLAALYAGGELEHARVELDERDGTLTVTIHARFKPRLTEIEVVGPSLRWRSRVSGWLELHRHGPVTAGEIESGVRRVLRELRRRGFSEATVEPELDYNHATNTVALKLLVALGEPLRVASVIVNGLPEGEEQLTTVADISPGEQLSNRWLDRTRRRVEVELRQRGYWEAEVTGTEQRQEGSRAEVVLNVDPGKRYQLAVTGPPGAEEMVHKALPDPVDEDLHPAQTAALEERIREELQKRGRLLAEAKVRLISEAPDHTVHVELDPDRPRQVTEVSFVGGDSLPRDQLAAAVAVRPGKTKGWRGREVTDTSLERDRYALADRFRAHGYAEVVVEPAVISPDGDHGAKIIFTIDQGRRWMITEIRYDGFPSEAAAAIEGGSLLPGRPWDEREVEPERRRLELVLASSGYPDGRVAAEVDTSTPGEARVAMRAVPGSFVIIAEVVIAGLRSVREAVVKEALKRAGLVTGAPYTLQAVLEAQRQLYELGLFRQVEVVPIPGQEHRAQQGLVVRCDEGLQKSYLLGAGWDTSDKLRVTLGWSHLNLFGGAHAFSVEARVSSREQRFQMSLREASVPWLGEPGAMVAYRTEEDFATYSQRRLGFWIEAGDRRRQPFRRWLRYEYQTVRPDAPDEVLSELERQDQEIRMSSLTPNLEWDTRNDLLRPTKGSLATMSLEYAFPLIRADANFLKLQTSYSLYGRLLGGTGAFGLRLGAIKHLGESTNEPANLQVPLNVRFFAGGRASHRAFELDQLGIPGQTLDEEGNAIGGNALLVVNLEYQRSIRGPIAGVVFVDVGNVWAEPASVNLNELRWGAGLGVRVDTPAGPLRLEYGFKLDREPDESSGELFLSFGVPF